MTTNDLMLNFPFAEPRPGMEKALLETDKAFNDGKKFVIFEGPTGSGKSSAAVTIARKYNAVILTPTKLLQDQYANQEEFDKEYQIRGKSNYQCGLNGFDHVPVDQALCLSDRITYESRSLISLGVTFQSRKGSSRVLKDACCANEICPYYTKIRKIGKVPGAVLNYDLFFRLKRYPGQTWGTPMGDTLILDEAHQLVSKMREIFGFKFSNIIGKRLLGNVGQRLQEETPVAWLERTIEIAKARFQMESDPKKSSKYDNFIKRASSILEEDLADTNKFFIDDKKNEIEIKPLDMRLLKSKIFYPFKRVLFLSATFPANFNDIFGLNEEETVSISIPSDFNKSKRPIFFAKDLPNLNRNSLLKKGDSTLSMLDSILKHHAKHKGIIHTGNYKFMDQLRRVYGRDKRFIWVTQDSDKDQMLEKHIISKEPSILVSPSLMEGVDLKDDLARFGVTLKVPFPMLDDYTKRMMSIFPSWYDNLTATSICQSYGRQVRSSDDWANYYILDGQFWNCVSRAKHCYSKYFLEALKVGSKSRLNAILQKVCAAGL